MGCGRLFEGDADQMFANMQRFKALSDDTTVYCAHEYTQSNGRFALVAEPDNVSIVERMKRVDAARARGEPTVPTTIAAEKERKSVGWGKSVSVRVDIGGRRIINKKKIK